MKQSITIAIILLSSLMAQSQSKNPYDTLSLSESVELLYSMIHALPVNNHEIIAERINFQNCMTDITRHYFDGRWEIYSLSYQDLVTGTIKISNSSNANSRSAAPVNHGQSKIGTECGVEILPFAFFPRISIDTLPATKQYELVLSTGDQRKIKSTGSYFNAGKRNEFSLYSLNKEKLEQIYLLLKRIVPACKKDPYQD